MELFKQASVPALPLAQGAVLGRAGLCPGEIAVFIKCRVQASQCRSGAGAGWAPQSCYLQWGPAIYSWDPFLWTLPWIHPVLLAPVPAVCWALAEQLAALWAGAGVGGS